MCVYVREVCVVELVSGCLLACDEGDLMTLQLGDAKAVLTRLVSVWGQ